jgi:bifunctional ADP-heptose synthase (sugar kinase/adenylyltransferase)
MGDTLWTRGLAALRTAQTQQELADGADIVFDVSKGGYGYVTLAGSRNIDVSNPVAGRNYVLRIIQGGTGGNTLTWSAINFDFPGGVEPVLSSGVGEVDELEFRCFDGSTLTLTNALFDIK